MKRSVRLRVIGGSIELRDDVPATRADCPSQRPCPHVHCKWHLWLVEAHDRQGRARTSTLRPVWIWRWPLPPSCALDVAEDVTAERGPRTIARYLDLGREQVRLIIREAVAKLAAHQQALGATPRDPSGGG